MPRPITDLVPHKDQREYIDSRVRDIEGAGQRSRWLYGLMIAIAWVMIAMAFNTTLSFMRDFAHDKETEPVWFVSPQSKGNSQTTLGREYANPRSIDTTTNPSSLRDGFEVSEPAVDGSVPSSFPDPSRDQSHGLAQTGDSNDVADNSGHPNANERQMLGRQIMIQQLLRNWVDSLYFEVPVIGARFGAPDAGVIGGILLCILGVWSSYSARRENHLIFYIIRDAERYETDGKFRKYLKNQLHATQLFAKTSKPQALSADQLRPRGEDLVFRGSCELTVLPESKIDGIGDYNPIKQGSAIQLTASDGIIDGEMPNQGSEWRDVPLDSVVKISPVGEFRIAGQARCGPSLGSIEGEKVRSYQLKGQVNWREVDAATLRSSGRFWGVGERIATLLIFFLPTVALLLVFAGDIGSLFMNSPVRAEPEGECANLFIALCPNYWCPGLYARLGMSAALLISNGLIMRAAYRYQKATNSLLSYIDQVCWSRTLPGEVAGERRNRTAESLEHA